MRAYINGTSAISPQPTFGQEQYLPAVKAPSGDYFTALEPDYKDFIDPKQSRRMAKIIKMGIASALDCLAQANAQPEAIIVGTGLGCLQDTERFLADLVENDEGLLSPTAFIQSTHNTIAGQIALVLNCPHHNFTYAQRGHSFENSLEDAMLHLAEGHHHVLVGGVDEATPTLHKILSKLGCTDKSEGRFPALTTTDKMPTLGEGAAFFLLSPTVSDNSMACVENLHTFYVPDDLDDIKSQISNFLDHSHLSLADIDAVMMGYNGHEKDDNVYLDLQNSLWKDKTILSFKNLCGEYFTASAFGLHLATQTLHKQQFFENTVVQGDLLGSCKNILLYNHYKGQYHTLILISKCLPS